MGRPTEETQRGFGTPLDQELAGLCQALGHPARVQILRLLLAQGQGCFCGDLVKLLGLAQSTVSHHLKALRDAGLVTAEGSGPAVCYCVKREQLRRVGALIEQLGLDNEEEC